MNVIAINRSPRKKWNTATLLEKALEGADSVGIAKTNFIGWHGRMVMKNDKVRAVRRSGRGT
jgi:multimeric flavodoxin WrbA